jgi:histidyl-tRNA synthetase
MKAQFKLADRSGAELAVVVGPDELGNGVAKVQSLNTMGQELVPLDELVPYVVKRLNP